METLRVIFEVCTGILGIASLIAGLYVIFKWITDVKRKDDKASADIEELRRHTESEFSSIKEENTLICYGLSACLDGLIQQGCNHTVPLAKDKLDKHLNLKAHEQKKGA